MSSPGNDTKKCRGCECPAWIWGVHSTKPKTRSNLMLFHTMQEAVDTAEAARKENRRKKATDKKAVVVGICGMVPNIGG